MTALAVLAAFLLVVTVVAVFHGLLLADRCRRLDDAELVDLDRHGFLRDKTP